MVYKLRYGDDNIANKGMGVCVWTPSVLNKNRRAHTSETKIAGEKAARRSLNLVGQCDGKSCQT